MMGRHALTRLMNLPFFLSFLRRGRNTSYAIHACSRFKSSSIFFQASSQSFPIWISNLKIKLQVSGAVDSNHARSNLINILFIWFLMDWLFDLLFLQVGENEIYHTQKIPYNFSSLVEAFFMHAHTHTLSAVPVPVTELNWMWISEYCCEFELSFVRSWNWALF